MLLNSMVVFYLVINNCFGIVLCFFIFEATNFQTDSDFSQSCIFAFLTLIDFDKAVVWCMRSKDACWH